MRVFVTGATGFIGSAVVKELLAAGHEVLGMTRSDAGATALADAGAAVHRGTLEDLDSLRRGAADADAVIHTAFIHDFSKFAESCERDRQAIEALGAELEGSARPLLVTHGVGGLVRDGAGTEDDMPPPPSSAYPRASEAVAAALEARGVHAAVVRLPQVHDTTRFGLISPLIQIYREKGVCAYVGEGSWRWAATHVLDVARLYRLAIEKAKPGARYHAVAEEGVSMRAIAEAIGRHLDLPVRSVAVEDADDFFGWMAMFVEWNLAATSVKTRQELGWEPVGPGLIADLENGEY
ncbi:MAG TPA: SDR family oxidoreductase [Rhodanobacteraceae bacterium]